jgi:hypothetical protein
LTVIGPVIVLDTVHEPDGGPGITSDVAVTERLAAEAGELRATAIAIDSRTAKQGFDFIKRQHSDQIVC